MWLYALTLLRLTPAPTWCVKFVEASFAGFTAPDTRPQVIRIELVNTHTALGGGVLTSNQALQHPGSRECNCSQ